MPLLMGLEFEAVVLSLKPAAEIPQSTQAQLQHIVTAICMTGGKSLHAHVHLSFSQLHYLECHGW